MKIPVTIIHFANQTINHNTSAFRGAIITGNPNELFHNHIGQTLAYRYPRIQYKFHQKHFIITGIAEGVELLDIGWKIGDIRKINLQGENIDLLIESRETRLFSPEFSPEGFYYSILNWLPLNQENHLKFRMCPSIMEQITMLNKIITGNILSLYKGIGEHIDKQINIRLQEITRTRIVKYKNIPMISFDIKIHSNISLPEYLGLGKGCSRGHGIILKLFNQ